MEKLKSHPHIAYDANCLLYYCMHSEIHDGSYKIRVVFPDLTDKVRIITESLVGQGKKIKTIEIIYDEIAKSEKAGQVVNRLINLPEVRFQLRLKRGQRFPDTIKFRIIKSLDKKMRSLKGEVWFEIVSFMSPQDILDSIKNFYLSLRGDQRMIDLLRKKNRKSCYPSEEDMHLISFSSKHNIPILTNDSDFNLFKAELEANALCHKIFPLSDVVLN